MQVEEEGPKEYVDISRAPDKEMRPDRLVPSGVAARRPADGGAVPARLRVGATGSGPGAPLEPRANAHLRGRIPGNRGPCSALRRAICCVTLLDNIDILPSSGALHTVRPGHNASRAWL